MRTAAAACLGALVAAYLVCALSLPGSSAVMEVFRTWVHIGLMLAATGVGVLATRRAPRQERAAWAATTAGLAAFAAGEVVWRFAYATDPAPPYPSWADACWLASYPAFYVGLMLLVRSRVAGMTAGAWLDGLIACTAVAAAGVAFYFEPVLAATDGDATAIAMTMAYPIGDLLLWVLLLAALALSGWRASRGFALLAAGQVAITVGDAVLALQTASGTYVEGGWGDVMWPLGALLVAAAGFQPQPARATSVSLGGWREVAVPAACVVLAAVLQVLHDTVGTPVAVDVLVTATFLLVLLRAGLAMRQNLVLLARSHREATTDALTGLGNRRALLADLGAALADGRGHTLALFDLDGFKAYNDAFGHAAGDALLARLGAGLTTAAHPGRAYRLGGDEFCVLTATTGLPAHQVLTASSQALRDEGDGFRVGASHGAVTLPAEAQDVSAALNLADQRMYAHKHPSRSGTARRESHDVLLGVLDEREPALNAHARRVAGWALAVGRRLGLDGEALDELHRAAGLHDIGKTAIPDVILSKTGPLTAADWEFVRQHTVIGERIVARAPALRPVAALVRSSHERWDGQGYPDGLAGEGIPLGARIIAVCDAADALTSDRSYRPAQPLEAAVAELRRCAGSQFDPAIVDAFCAVVEDAELPVPA